MRTITTIVTAIIFTLYLEIVVMIKSYLLLQYYRLLGWLAQHYLNKWKPLVIGINGSVGKTSCRMIVHQVLQAHLGDQLVIYTSPKNFNGELGMSLSIFRIEEWTPSIMGMITALQQIVKSFHSQSCKPYDVIVIEYGIDRPGEMDFLCSICKPHISILTKLDAVHSLQFGSIDEIAHEELKLQHNTILHCYLNTADEYAMKIASQLKTKLSYYHTDEFHKEEANTDSFYSKDYQLIALQDTNSIGPVIARSLLHYGQKKSFFETSLLGIIHHDYIALAYGLVQSVRKQYNLAPIQMQSCMDIQLQPGRFSLFFGKYESILVDSTYNSSPLSVRKVLEESDLLQQTLYPKHRRLYVLGDMRELGQGEKQHHQELGQWLLKRYRAGDYVLLFGQAMERCYQQLCDSDMRVRHSTDRQQLIRKIDEILRTVASPFVITLKGSQNTIFLEEVTKYFLLHPEESDRLTRQGSWWKDKKE